MADFAVGQWVLFDGHRAIVQEVLERGVGILRKAGPRTGIPIFVQPSALTPTTPPEGAIAQPKAKIIAQSIAVPSPEAIAETAAEPVRQLSLLG